MRIKRFHRLWWLHMNFSIQASFICSNSAEFRPNRWVHCNDECNITMFIELSSSEWKCITRCERIVRAAAQSKTFPLAHTHTDTHAENTLIHSPNKSGTTNKTLHTSFPENVFFVMSIFIERFFVCNFPFSQQNEKKFDSNTRCRSLKLNHICLSNGLVAWMLG